MAQNFTTISPVSFSLQLPGVSTATLKRLMGYIYEWKKENRKRTNNVELISDKMILDMERKETLIYVELMRRGVLNKNTKADFAAWRRKLQGLRPKK